MNKQEILDNVTDYTAEQLVDFIMKGVVTFDELLSETAGMFDRKKRREVTSLLEQSENSDPDAWNIALQNHTLESIQKYLDEYPVGKFRSEAEHLKEKLEHEVAELQANQHIVSAWGRVNKESVRELEDFIRNYPDSTFVNQARIYINSASLKDILNIGSGSLVKKIRDIQVDALLTSDQKKNNIISEINEFIKKKIITKEDFLKELRNDFNLLNSGVVKELVDKEVLTIYDLQKIGIGDDFIKYMYEEISTQPITNVPPFQKINKKSTEIYFWGIPSSGKSCALGAILSVAANGSVAQSMSQDPTSQGYGYMNELITMFKDGEVGSLMEGTSINSFYEMGFDLEDNDGNKHPITCVDMAGELMRCMYKFNAKHELSDNDFDMLDTLTNVLVDNATISRKIHFFVIEYGAENRLYEGQPQRTYLNGALSYIKETGIFKKNTDAIYLMISKADKLKDGTKDDFAKYIDKHYLGFYNGLKQICKENEINGGKVERIAFSLGEVCFQNYCRFNEKPAENVVKIILSRSPKNSGGFFWRMKGILGK